MEEEEDKTVIGKCPGKLINLNAPLLSTRRTNIGINTTLEMPNASNSLDAVSWDMDCERIPFSWEQTPGKPKNYIETISTKNDFLQLPPRPPPSRWHLIKKEAAPVCGGNASEVDDPQREYDDGCDGDVDDDNIDKDGSGYEDGKDDDVISSNDLDIFSLAESVDTIETRDITRGTFTFRDRNLVEEEEGTMNMMISPSANFLIERFLPDAKALAASSALAIHKNKKYPNILRSNTCTSTGTGTGTSRAVSLRQSSPFSSSKGCGFDIFFPWRVKPKSGGMRSPVMALPASKLPWSGEKNDVV